MAVDNLEIEYYLTATGWVEGTHRFFGKIQGKKIEPPPNTVETWKYKIYQQSTWRREEISWECIWFDLTTDENQRRELRKKFPKPEITFPEK